MNDTSIPLLKRPFYAACPLDCTGYNRTTGAKVHSLGLSILNPNERMLMDPTDVNVLPLYREKLGEMV